jgi:hypothetical protein
MKQLILIMSLALSINAYSQDDKTVTLIVSGQGQIQDEAKQNALRNAIEQAFGTFISSNTEILNDELVKDEIVSVSNGNIQKFEIISEVQTPDGGYATALKATVSVTKLTSFVESKGVVVEFKGGLFASNILIQELYEKNEIEAIDNIVNVMQNISNTSFDYTINAADPFSNNGKWSVPITVNVIANQNFLNIPTLLHQTLKSICLSAGDLENYLKLNKPVYPITLATNNSNDIYYLRNETSINKIIDFVYSLNNSIVNFYISNGIDKYTIEKYNPGSKYSYDCNCSISNLEIDDINFRIILKNRNGGASCYICAASLFHNFCGSRHDSKIPNFNYKNVYKNGMSYGIEYGTYKDQYCSIFKRPQYKSFYPLKKLMLNNLKNQVLGLVISFASIKTNTSIVQFKFHDNRTIDELKEITKYEIIKKEI